MPIIRPRNYVASAFAAVLLSGGASAGPGLTTPEPVGTFLDGAFPKTSPGTSPDAAWVQEDYYPGLTFVEPVRIIQHPALDRLVVVCKDGKGWSVTHAPGATDKQLFFDISSIMHGKSDIAEGGISDLVFHPEFGQNGSPNANYVYISYRFAPGKGGTFDDNPTVDGYNRLSRFSVVSDQVDLSTEVVLMSQFDREQWHIGMDLEFGRDGFMYISVGDEGNCCDRMESTQHLDGGLWSGILRIDVNQDAARSHPIRRQPTHLGKDPTENGPDWPPSRTQGYFIPNDNPFLDQNGGNLEEFYSIGLRHPWTISFDEATGNLWAADVGQNDREEINLVRKGDNHQWGYAEGTLGGVIPRPQNIIGNEAPPVWEYDHGTGKAVIGGGVYRGDQFPELVGKYLFSDFMSGILWTATPQADAVYKVEQIGELTSGFPNGINSYLLDNKGDILLARSKGSLQPGSVERLVRSSDAVAAPEPPGLLSQTGAFTDLLTLTPRAGCIPYELNVPFWSDNAIKTRWMCVPNDGTHDTEAEQVTITAQGDWQFPVGSVLIKHFNLLMNESDPQSAVRVETRFLVQGEDRHYGVTYRWKGDGTDAELLRSAVDIDFNIQASAGPRQQTWHIPGRNECQTCHGAATIGVLGPKSRQLNRDAFYPSSGLQGNQLETLNALGIVKVDVANLGTLLTSTPTSDCSAPIEDRARSYLDANCGYCHRPNGVRANFDARLTTLLNESKIVGGSLAESLSIAGEAVVVPGDLERSVAYLRGNSVAEGVVMPPLAKSLVDQPGMSVLAAWIGFLASGDPNAGKDLCFKGPGGAGSGGSGGPGGSAGGLAAGLGGATSQPGSNGGLGADTPGASRDGGCACALGPRPLSQRTSWAWLLAGLAAAVARRSRTRQHVMTRKQLAGRSVIALSLAMLVGACGENGVPSAPSAPSQSTAGSPTALAGNGGGGGNPNVVVPEPIMGGTGGTEPQAMAGTAGAGGAAPEVKTKISVLIVDGFNNHVWQVVTKRYLTILGRDAIFDPVVVSTVPPENDPAWSAWKPDFEAYDVIIQNTTDIQTAGKWPRETELALEQYMLSGGRMLTHHAANHGFEHWVEYNRMIGLSWRSKDYGSALTVAENGAIVPIPPGSGTDTRHDYRGDALIQRLADHPIYTGLPAEFMAREIEVIQFMRGPAENVTVLSYSYDPVEDLNFPISWLVQYGQGLVYNSNYGHVYGQAPEDGVPESMRCAAFETVHDRALRWLAGVTEMPPVPADFPTRDATSVRAQ